MLEGSSGPGIQAIWEDFRISNALFNGNKMLCTLTSFNAKKLDRKDRVVFGEGECEEANVKQSSDSISGTNLWQQNMCFY